MLTYLQADIPLEGVAIQSRDNVSVTRKETIMLPAFSENEVTAYLTYPMWRKQWMSHIADYEEKY